MTPKQTAILDTALKLFAQQGFSATPTSQIAKQAGVSEGLIFRHFTNKDGLLNSVLQIGAEGFNKKYTEIAAAGDAKAVLRKAILLPFEVPPEEYEFWRLQFKLKWELNYHNSETTQPFIEMLQKAFAELAYSQPRLEAMSLMFLIEGLSTTILKSGLDNQEEIKEFLLKKYDLV